MCVCGLWRAHVRVTPALSSKPCLHTWLPAAAAQVTCSRGSPKRQLLLQKRGAFQVPYLEDPAAGVYLFESSAIVQYLRNTYGLAQGTPAPAATGDAAP